MYSCCSWLVLDYEDVCASIACTSTKKSVSSNGNAAAALMVVVIFMGSFEFDGSGDYTNLQILVT